MNLDMDTPVEELSYEQARQLLTVAVQQLSNTANPLSLEDAVKVWERGEALVKRCQSVLSQARAKLEATQEPQG